MPNYVKYAVQKIIKMMISAKNPTNAACVTTSMLYFAGIVLNIGMYVYATTAFCFAKRKSLLAESLKYYYDRKCCPLHFLLFGSHLLCVLVPPPHPSTITCSLSARQTSTPN